MVLISLLTTSIANLFSICQLWHGVLEIIRVGALFFGHQVRVKQATTHSFFMDLIVSIMWLMAR